VHVLRNLPELCVGSALPDMAITIFDAGGLISATAPATLCADCCRRSLLTELVGVSKHMPTAAHVGNQASSACVLSLPHCGHGQPDVPAAASMQDAAGHVTCISLAPWS
jgi:hypothetical protein